MSLVVKCPNCGTEFEPVKKGEESKYETPVDEMNGVGYLIPKTIHNDNLPRDEKGRFVKRETVVADNVENKENKSMENNNFNLDMLAQMVADRIKDEALNVMKNEALNVPSSAADIRNETMVSSSNVKGNNWARNSKFYGKEICGFMYNPYLVRRFLPSQFLNLMNRNDLNVNQSIREQYTYIKAIKYLVEECNTLAMIQKKDKIAFEERKIFWSVDDIKIIFTDYLNDIKKYVEDKVSYSRGKDVYIKGFGCIKVSSREEVIKHKAVWINDFDRKETFAKINMLIKDIKTCHTYKALADKLNAFKLIKIPSEYNAIYHYDRYEYRTYYTYTLNRNGYRLPNLFIENFKKAGAYYTLKNLIMFNNVYFEGAYGREAVNKLRNYLVTIPNSESYKFYAKLKEVIKLNRIDITKYNR